MADNDSSIIKPVESLQNIAGLKPIKHREERKRRQNLPGEDEKKSEQEQNNSIDEQNQVNEISENEQDQRYDSEGIDYFA